MNITFQGHSCFTVEIGSNRLIIDPFLNGNPVAELKPEDVECDYIIITHGHGDHIGDSIAIAKNNDAMIVSNYEIITYAQQNGVKNAHPMHIGGAHEFPFGRVKFTIAHHGSTLTTDKGMIPLGNPMGVLITGNGKTLYHSGDTGLFLDMQLIGEMNRIDTALLPIGDNFTMGVDDAVKAAEFLKAKVTIPMHYNTFDLLNQNANDFIGKLAKKGLEAHILNVGDSYEF
ncbi:MAG: metal-dependent hydrolase [Deferribacteres bacterium]|nr:metal-dependent hydrolase [candidate division KSB1 bacterium]MCB9501265.1 metal-dependent hydrolase [Deferribacteres bacterium]